MQRDSEILAPLDACANSKLIGCSSGSMGSMTPLAEGDRCAYFVVLSGHRYVMALMLTVPATAKGSEQVSQIDIIKATAMRIEAMLPVRRRCELLAGGPLAQIIVGLALLGVLQRCSVW